MTTVGQKKTVRKAMPFFAHANINERVDAFFVVNAGQLCVDIHRCVIAKVKSEHTRTGHENEYDEKGFEHRMKNISQHRRVPENQIANQDECESGKQSDERIDRKQETFFFVRLNEKHRQPDKKSRQCGERLTGNDFARRTVRFLNQKLNGKESKQVTRAVFN